MTFEHIVQINDVTKPEIPMLTRFQVWEGLQLPGLRVIDEVTFGMRRASRIAVIRCPMISISTRPMWPQTWKPFRSSGSWWRQECSEVR